MFDFNNLFHIDDLIPGNIKVDKKSHLGIPTYYIGFKKSYRIKLMFIIFDKINVYFEDDEDDSYETKYLTLTLNNE